MMRSLYNGVAGVRTHSYGMDLLANNISNINTVGYKAAVPEFKDVFYQLNYESGVNLGANSVGLAATGASSAYSQKQGSLQITDRPFDLAIEGRGFFAIKDADAQVYYTRNGDFALDKDSYLTDSFGRYVLGTMNAGFKAQQMSSELAKLYSNDGKSDGYVAGFEQDIKLNEPNEQSKIKLPPNLFCPSQATKNVNIKANLSAKSNLVHKEVALKDLHSTIKDDEQILQASGVKPEDEVIFEIDRGHGKERIKASVSDGKAILKLKPPFAKDDFSASVLVSEDEPVSNLFTHQIISNNGAKNILELNFVKKAEKEDGGIIFDAKALIKDEKGKILADNQGEVSFNSDGSLASNLLKTIGDIKLNFGSASKKQGDKLIGSFDGLTCIQSSQDLGRQISSDGNEAGLLKSYYVDEKGNLLASFTNGKSQAIAKVAVYNFINEQGLSKNGDNEFSPTIDSGEPMFYKDQNNQVFLPGKIKSSALEQSNVDLATELTHVIAFQKAYEASAKSITTADQMLKRAIEMKK